MASLLQRSDFVLVFKTLTNFSVKIGGLSNIPFFFYMMKMSNKMKITRNYLSSGHDNFWLKLNCPLWFLEFVEVSANKV